MWRKRRRSELSNGARAAQEVQAAKRRLEAAKRQWPEVRATRDALEEMVQQALRGGRA
jgi:hypothetical protein